jgi:hypothetical protein
VAPATRAALQLRGIQLAWFDPDNAIAIKPSGQRDNRACIARQVQSIMALETAIAASAT